MLEGKRILVVGAGGLLGRKIVSAIICSGGEVVAADIGKNKASYSLKEDGLDLKDEKLSIINLDICNEKEVKKYFGSEVKLDGAVNASYPRSVAYGKKLFDVSLSDFNENVSLHLGSAFLFSQQCAVYFTNNSLPFSLVNIASVYGVVAPKFEMYDGTEMTMPVEYSAIKSAILHLNKYISSYVKNSHFRVNAVSPGGLLDGQNIDFVNSYNALSRGKGMLDPQDIVGSIIFLLSDNSRYVTGQNIGVEDGFSL